MKRKVCILMIFLASQIVVQCSGDTFDSYRPVGKPDSKPVTGEGQNPRPLSPILYDNGENGYAETYNASMVVESIDSYDWDPQFDYLRDWILGVRLPNPEVTASNTTNLYFDFDYSDRVYIHLPTFHFSVLGYDWMRWSITSSFTIDRMEMDGTSTWGMAECPVNSNDNSSNTFHFEGSYDEVRNAYKGIYTWTQESSEEGCTLSCSGVMTVLFHELRM